MHKYNFEETRKDNSEKETNYGPEFDDDEIVTQNKMYPYSIVWTALPLISWILPFIGHTGICE